MSNGVGTARLRGGVPTCVVRCIVFADFSIITGYGKDSMPAARYFNYKLYRHSDEPLIRDFDHKRIVKRTTILQKRHELFQTQAKT